MIGVPSFFLALEPNTDMVKGKFLRNVLFRAFPGSTDGCYTRRLVSALSDAFSLSHELASAVAFYLYSFVAYLMLFKVCKPMNLLHKILFGSMGILFILAACIIPEWFNIVSLDYGSALILFTLILLAVPINIANRETFQQLQRLETKNQKFYYPRHRKS